MMTINSMTVVMVKMVSALFPPSPFYTLSCGEFCCVTRCRISSQVPLRSSLIGPQSQLRPSDTLIPVRRAGGNRGPRGDHSISVAEGSNIPRRRERSTAPHLPSPIHK